LQPFTPLFRNPHLASIAGNFWPRRLDLKRFPVTARLFQTEPDVQILVHSQQPEAPAKGEVIVVHGLEGSSQSGYACSLAQAALEAGFAVHRFHMRSCGGTEALSGRTLYHSGQTSDLLAVTRQLAAQGRGPLYWIGFSLGGNVVLKLAGELGEQARELVTSAAAASTPIDLAACARLLDKPSNFIYANRFLDRLKQRIRVKEKLSPGLFPLDGIDQVRTIWEFDDRFTALSFGFGTAANYYATQSSNQFLEHIRVPCLVVQAKDDPLIPFHVYDHPAFARNPCLRLLAAESGGHLGFLSRGKPRFWLDGVLVEWLQETGTKAIPVSSTTLHGPNCVLS
jgi:predicted alpha/beta-fold hydrolase